MIPFITYQIGKFKNFNYTVYGEIDILIQFTGKDIN